MFFVNYSSFDKAFVATVYAICMCGFLLNSFLLFIIIFKSPAHLSPYRIFLADTALSQTLTVIVYMLLSPRVLASGFNIVVIYLGPSQFLGQTTCYMLYTTMLHLSINAFMSWMIAIIYRYMCLPSTEISRSTVILMCLAAYLIPLSMVVSFTLLPSSQVTSINLRTSNNATEADIVTDWMIPNMQSYRMVITADIRQPGLLYSIVCCSVLLIPIYTTMYVCRRKIHSKLEKTSRSPQTRLHVKRLVKALMLQSLVPVLAIFPPVIAYLLMQFGVIGHQVPSYFILPSLSVGPLLDPLITTYYVYPYRIYVKQLFFPCMKERSTRSSIST